MSSVSDMIVYGKSMYCPICSRKFKGQEHWGGLPTVEHDADPLAPTACPNSGKVFVFPTSQVSSS